MRTHPLLFGLLGNLDLDFVLTSERLWGDHPTVPSLAIYEALRAPGERGIAVPLHLGRARARRRRMTLPDWLADPALRPVWRRLRGPLERGVRTTRLTALDRATRHALSGVLGRPLVGDVPLVLTDVSALVESRAGSTLEQVVVAASGPLRDRAAEQALRAAPLEILAVVDPSWAEDVRRSGLLTRVPAPASAAQRRALWA